jgi:hypothetical protein
MEFIRLGYKLSLCRYNRSSSNGLYKSIFHFSSSALCINQI